METAPSADIAQHLIAELLQSDRSIPEIAEAFSLSFTELLQILESPAAQAELAALAKIAELREAHRAPKRREAALARLATIAETEPDNREARRAASTLLRNLKPPRPRATDQFSGRCDHSKTPDASPPRATDPSSGRCDDSDAIVQSSEAQPSAMPAQIAHSFTSTPIASRLRRRRPHGTVRRVSANRESVSAGSPHSGQTAAGGSPRKS